MCLGPKEFSAPRVVVVVIGFYYPCRRVNNSWRRIISLPIIAAIGFTIFAAVVCTSYCPSSDVMSDTTATFHSLLLDYFVRV